MNQRELNVLLIDTNKKNRDPLAALLSGRGHEVTMRGEAGDVVDRAAQQTARPVDLIVLSFPLGGGAATEQVIEELAANAAAARVPVIVTSRGASDWLLNAVHAHPRAKLLKRDDLTAVIDAVRAVERWDPGQAATG